MHDHPYRHADEDDDYQCGNSHARFAFKARRVTFGELMVSGHVGSPENSVWPLPERLLDPYGWPDPPADP